MKDVQAFSEDILEVPTFVYYFVGCDLQTVKSVDFNYDNDKPVDIQCDWLYQYYEEMTFDEYNKRYGSEANYEPNGNVEAELESIDENPAAHQEYVEEQWRNSINQSDLDMIRNEQLLNPALADLPDLD